MYLLTFIERSMVRISHKLLTMIPWRGRWKDQEGGRISLSISSVAGQDGKIGTGLTLLLEPTTARQKKHPTKIRQKYTQKKIIWNNVSQDMEGQ